MIVPPIISIRHWWKVLPAVPEFKNSLKVYGERRAVNSLCADKHYWISMLRPVIYIFTLFIYYILMHGKQLKQPLQVYLHSLIDCVKISYWISAPLFYSRHYGDIYQGQCSNVHQRDISTLLTSPNHMPKFYKPTAGWNVLITLDIRLHHSPRNYIKSYNTLLLKLSTLILAKKSDM